MEDGAQPGIAHASRPVTTIGASTLLDQLLLAFFCSQKCPGSLILATYDLVRALRDRDVPIIGGFQTPVERECLTLLLRGGQPVVVCPNRGIEGMRVAPEWREPVQQGRLLLASPFPAHERRKTRELGERRNAFVVEHAENVLVTYANPGGATERAAHLALSTGKPVFTVADPATAHLVAAGAVALPVPELIEALSQRDACPPPLSTLGDGTGR